MKSSMLANHLIALEYVGTDVDYGKAAFDADGGTSAGKLTLTVDETASVYDLGDTSLDTLEKLVESLGTADDWYVFYPLPLNLSNNVKTADFTQRPLADLTEMNMENGRVHEVIGFTNEYEAMANGANELQTPILKDVSCVDEVLVTLAITGTDGGASEACTLTLGTLSADKRASSFTGSNADTEDDFGQEPWLASVDFDDGASFEDTIAATLSGTTEVIASEVVNVRGVDFMYAKSFNNGNANTVNIEVFLSM